jgi:PAS domain S-box-containing protein
MNQWPHRKKILVVDDQPENIHILIESLEEKYEIFFATNGEKALNFAFSKERPDLILLDIQMPGIDGYEVCTRLKANTDTRDIPVIFITASGQQEDETRGLRLGAVDFITKPFSLPIVEARVKTALRLKEEMDRRMTLAQELEDLNKNLERRIKEKTTELEQAHEHLKVSERKFREIYANAIEGIFQTTRDGGLISASPSFAQTLGFESPEEVLATTQDVAMQLYAHPEDRNRFKQMLEQHDEISGFETQFRKKNGAIIDVAISAKVIRDERGNFLHYQGFSVDVTEQKRARELEIANKRLQELDELRSALMSTASHDMRSPLTCILGFTQMIGLRFTRFFLPLCKGDKTLLKEAKEIIRSLQIIEQEGKRLVRLINDFLDLSRFESGCSKWHDCPIQMTEIIEASTQAIRGQLIGRPELTLHVAHEPNLPVIVCDKDRLMQVMINLLSNAIKFTEKGSISVQTSSAPGDAIDVRISDTGPGVPDDEKENVFERFHQLRQGVSRNKRLKGTGLGLAICKQIIEHYGGKIWVESTLGQGSTFIFRIPR